MYLSVYVTAASAEEAERIAGILVEEKLAACVNYYPCRSVYRWQGAVERGDEYILVCKTKKALYDRLQSRIKEVHSYAVPAIVAMDICDGDTEYLNWIEDETREP